MYHADRKGTAPHGASVLGLEPNADQVKLYHIDYDHGRDSQGDRMADIAPRRLSRRALLGGAAIIGVGGAAYALRGGARMERHAVTDAKTLNRGNNAEPDTLDPHQADSVWENNIIGDMLIGLMADDAAGQPIPGAAESYSASEDGLTYTFKLRDHFWSDGVKVTAHDFVYSFRRVLLPKTAAQYATILYPIKNAEALNAGNAPPEALGVRAIDDMTLEITFSSEVPYITQLLTHYATFAVPRHVVEKHGKDWTKPENIVTNGPYILAEWVSGDHVKLTKNPRFYDKESVKIDTVFFYPTQDASAAVKRFRGGELDVVTDSVPPQQTQWLKREIPNELRLHSYMLTQYVVFNFTRKPFDDLRVRKALSLAIDREMIVAKITRGGELPAYSLVPPNMPFYPKRAELEFKPASMAARIAEAKALLNEAGFNAIHPLRFVFDIQTTTEAKIVAVALQEMWRAIGADVRLALSESQVHYNSMRRQDFDAAWAGWSADYRDPKNFLFSFQSSTKDLNFGAYKNSEYDDLMNRSDLERDPVARAELLRQAEQRMLDDMAVAPVYFGVTRDLVSTEVMGWLGNDLNVHRSRYLWLDRRQSST